MMKRKLIASMENADATPNAAMIIPAGAGHRKHRELLRALRQRVRGCNCSGATSEGNRVWRGRRCKCGCDAEEEAQHVDLPDFNVMFPYECR